MPNFDFEFTFDFSEVAHTSKAIDEAAIDLGWDSAFGVARSAEKLEWFDKAREIQTHVFAICAAKA